MKSILLVAAVALVLLGGVWLVLKGDSETAPVAVPSYRDIAYRIDGEQAYLLDESQSSDAALSVETRYFGNELWTDLNGDGQEDVAFVVTQSAGGSGTFYYAVAAIATDAGYVGSDGYLLGDRIAPQSTEVSPNPRHQHVVVFNYADRLPAEPMSASPSVGQSAYLKLDPDSLQWGIVEPDFEGESR